MVRFLALRLQQVTSCLHLLKTEENDVVWLIVLEFHTRYAIDMQGVSPDSVLSHIRKNSGLISNVREGYSLTLLCEHIVVVHVLQGIDTIFTCCHTLNREVTAGISSSHTL